MNETRGIDLGRPDGDVMAFTLIGRDGTKREAVYQQFHGRRPMVYKRNRPIDETRIVWNSGFEVYECIKCHSIMFYDFSFEYCPYCSRPIVREWDRG